jgi:hypothetical protein
LLLPHHGLWSFQRWNKSTHSLNYTIFQPEVIGLGGLEVGDLEMFCSQVLTDRPSSGFLIRLL